VALKHSLVIEATEDPNFFSFYSPDLEGFTGVGHSIEDCLYKGRSGGWKNIWRRWTMKDMGLQAPRGNPDADVVIKKIWLKLRGA